jgi:two-component system KDP operon response regulator KdpE
MDEGAHRKKSILVVDDEPRIGKILSIKLRLYGYEVITTTSGAEAIELIRTKEPDIVLLDMLLPDVAGLEVLGRVRAFSQVPIVVFTAKPDIIQSAIKLGANDSITKPFDPDQVVKKIGTILGSANQK